MHVLITKTFTDLGVTHEAGTNEHVATSVAERYFGAGVAKRYVYASVAERFAEEEKQRVAAIPEHLRETPDMKWGVRRLVFSQKWVVTSKQLGSENIYGEVTLLTRGLPDPVASERQAVDVLKAAKCPQSIIDTWLAKKNT